MALKTYPPSPSCPCCGRDYCYRDYATLPGFGNAHGLTVTRTWEHGHARFHVVCTELTATTWLYESEDAAFAAVRDAAYEGWNQSVNRSVEEQERNDRAERAAAQRYQAQIDYACGIYD